MGAENLSLESTPEIVSQKTIFEPKTNIFKFFIIFLFMENKKKGQKTNNQAN